MLHRRLTARLNQLLRHSPVVVLLGPRQAGKTTLALELGAAQILDELHRVPELFQRLRGVIDRGRRQGQANGRFLLLGSAGAPPGGDASIGEVNRVGS